MANRRSFLQSALGLGAGLFAARSAAETSHPAADPTSQVAARGGYLGVSSGSLSKVETHAGPVHNVSVITTDVGDLPFEMDGEVKVFRLTAHVFKRQIAPDKTIDVWGFNGSAPGPTIQVTQGDRIRVIFKNELPEPSSLHWHGFEDLIGTDGMPGISQEPVAPGESFTYDFTIRQEGTYFYHSHMAMQEMAGMLGAVVMHPKVPYRPHCEKDFVIHLQEYWVLPNGTTPNTMNMEFNWLLLNGRAGPATTPLIVRQGERVRIRFLNLGMDHHPMHLHGHTFYVTGTEGGRIPETAWWPGNTVLVGVAQARAIEFVADNPGDWMVHCHLPHHMMNQMATQVGPMTRMAASAGGQHMQNMSGIDMPGMDMRAPEAAARQAGPLADRPLDAGMAGMMREQSGQEMKLSAEQRRDLDAFDLSAGSMNTQTNELAPNAGDVPNFPQDAYMEGPMMNMDQLVQKPENLGLRPNWSRFMQGMMTFIRVLPAEQYDQVVAAMRDAKRPGDPYASLYTATKLVLALTLALGATLHAQQPMPDMPGMKMDPQPATQQQSATPRPNRTPQTPDPMAPDAKRMGGDAEDARARAAAASVRRSFQQQAGLAQHPPGADSDAGSLHVPVQQLQEPEAIGFHTGADLPAPELLGDVTRREPMTVEAFLALADRDNPTLAQAQRDVERSAQQARQIGLPPDPKVGYSGDHIRGGSYHGGEEGPFFSQEFVLGRKLALRKAIYRAEGRANEFAVAVQRARVHNDVGQAFFDALAAQETVAVENRLLQVALDAEINAHELQRVGQMDTTEVLSAEITAEQAKVEFVEAQRAFLAGFSRLANFAGQASLTPHPLAGSLIEPPEIDPAEMVATDTRESPAVRQAEASVQVAETRMKDARRERVPNLNVKAGEWYSGEELGTTTRKAGWESFAEAGVQIPLWNRNQGNIEAARVELERAHEDVTRTGLSTRSRAEPLAQQYQTARFTAERYRTQMLPRARRACELEVTKYQEMGEAYAPVLAAQHMLFTLQLTYLRALNEEWRAAIGLQNYALMNALQEPKSAGQDATTINLPTAPGGGS